MKALLTRARPDLVGCALLFVAILWTLYRTGVRPFIMLQNQVLSTQIWPRLPTGLEDQGNWTWGSPSGLAIGRLLGTDNDTSFLVQQAVVILIGILVMISVLIRELPNQHSWRAGRFLILGSLGAVLIHWLGIYDSYTFLFWTFFLLAWSFKSVLGLVASGFLLGFQHINQGLFGLVAFWIAIWALSYWSSNKFGRLAAFSFLGLFLGKIFQITFYWILQTDLTKTTFGREAIVFSFAQFETEMRLSLSFLPVLLWSTFAGFWLVVAIVISSLPQKRQILIAVTLLALFGLAAMAGDKTRVFVMMAFPTMFIFVIYYFRLNVGRRTTNLVELALWLTYPLILFHKWILPTGWPDSLLDQFLNLPTFFI